MHKIVLFILFIIAVNAQPLPRPCDPSETPIPTSFGPSCIASYSICHQSNCTSCFQSQSITYCSLYTDTPCSFAQQQAACGFPTSNCQLRTWANLTTEIVATCQYRLQPPALYTRRCTPRETLVACKWQPDECRVVCDDALLTVNCRLEYQCSWSTGGQNSTWQTSLYNPASIGCEAADLAAYCPAGGSCSKSYCLESAYFNTSYLRQWSGNQQCQQLNLTGCNNQTAPMPISLIRNCTNDEFMLTCAANQTMCRANCTQVGIGRRCTIEAMCGQRGVWDSYMWNGTYRNTSTAKRIACGPEYWEDGFFWNSNLQIQCESNQLNPEYNCTVANPTGCQLRPANLTQQNRYYGSVRSNFRCRQWTWVNGSVSVTCPPFASDPMSSGAKGQLQCSVDELATTCATSLYNCQKGCSDVACNLTLGYTIRAICPEAMAIVNPGVVLSIPLQDMLTFGMTYSIYANPCNSTQLLNSCNKNQTYCTVVSGWANRTIIFQQAICPWSQILNYTSLTSSNPYANSSAPYSPCYDPVPLCGGETNECSTSLATGSNYVIGWNGTSYSRPYHCSLPGYPIYLTQDAIIPCASTGWRMCTPDPVNCRQLAFDGRRVMITNYSLGNWTVITDPYPSTVWPCYQGGQYGLPLNYTLNQTCVPSTCGQYATDCFGPLGCYSTGLTSTCTSATYCQCSTRWPIDFRPCDTTNQTIQCSPSQTRSLCGSLATSCRARCAGPVGAVGCDTSVNDGETCTCVSSGVGRLNGLACSGWNQTCDIGGWNACGPYTSSCYYVSPTGNDPYDPSYPLQCRCSNGQLASYCDQPSNTTQCTAQQAIAACGAGGIGCLYSNVSQSVIPSTCQCNTTNYFLYNRTCLPGHWIERPCSPQESWQCDTPSSCMMNCTSDTSCSLVRSSCYNTLNLTIPCPLNISLRVCGSQAAVASCEIDATYDQLNYQYNLSSVVCNCSVVNQLDNETLALMAANIPTFYGRPCIARQDVIQNCNQQQTVDLCGSYTGPSGGTQYQWFNENPYVCKRNYFTGQLVPASCPATFTVQPCSEEQLFTNCPLSNQTSCQVACSTQQQDCRLYGQCSETLPCNQTQYTDHCGQYSIACRVFSNQSLVPGSCVYQCPFPYYVGDQCQLPLARPLACSNENTTYCGPVNQTVSCELNELQQPNCTCKPGFGPVQTIVQLGVGVQAHPQCAGTLVPCLSAEVASYAGQWAISCSLYCIEPAHTFCRLASYQCQPGAQILYDPLVPRDSWLRGPNTLWPIMDLPCGQLWSIQNVTNTTDLAAQDSNLYPPVVSTTSLTGIVTVFCGQYGQSVQINTTYSHTNGSVLLVEKINGTCQCQVGWSVGSTDQCNNQFTIRPCTPTEMAILPSTGFCNWTVANCQMQCNGTNCFAYAPTVCFDAIYPIPCNSSVSQQQCGSTASSCLVDCYLSRDLQPSIICQNLSTTRCKCSNLQTDDWQSSCYQVQPCVNSSVAKNYCGVGASGCQLYDYGPLIPPVVKSCDCQPPFSANRTQFPTHCGYVYAGDSCDIQPYAVSNPETLVGLSGVVSCGPMTQQVYRVCQNASSTDCQPVCVCRNGTGDLLGQPCAGWDRDGNVNECAMCQVQNITGCRVRCTLDQSVCILLEGTCTSNYQAPVYQYLEDGVTRIRNCTNDESSASCGPSGVSRCYYYSGNQTFVNGSCQCDASISQTDPLLRFGYPCVPWFSQYVQCNSSQLALCGSQFVVDCRMKHVFTPSNGSVSFTSFFDSDSAYRYQTNPLYLTSRYYQECMCINFTDGRAFPDRLPIYSTFQPTSVLWPNQRWIPQCDHPGLVNMWLMRTGRCPVGPNTLPCNGWGTCPWQTINNCLNTWEGLLRTQMMQSLLNGGVEQYRVRYSCPLNVPPNTRFYQSRYMNVYGATSVNGNSQDMPSNARPWDKGLNWDCFPVSNQQGVTALFNPYPAPCLQSPYVDAPSRNFYAWQKLMASIPDWVDPRPNPFYLFQGDWEPGQFSVNRWTPYYPDGFLDAKTQFTRWAYKDYLQNYMWSLCAIGNFYECGQWCCYSEGQTYYDYRAGTHHYISVGCYNGEMASYFCNPNPYPNPSPGGAPDWMRQRNANSWGQSLKFMDTYQGNQRDTYWIVPYLSWQSTQGSSGCVSDSPTVYVDPATGASYQAGFGPQPNGQNYTFQQMFYSSLRDLMENGELGLPYITSNWTKPAMQIATDHYYGIYEPRTPTTYRYDTHLPNVAYGMRWYELDVAFYSSFQFDSPRNANYERFFARPFYTQRGDFLTYMAWFEYQDYIKATATYAGQGSDSFTIVTTPCNVNQCQCVFQFGGDDCGNRLCVEAGRLGAGSIGQSCILFFLGTGCDTYFQRCNPPIALDWPGRVGCVNGRFDTPTQRCVCDLGWSDKNYASRDQPWVWAPIPPVNGRGWDYSPNQCINFQCSGFGGCRNNGTCIGWGPASRFGVGECLCPSREFGRCDCSATCPLASNGLKCSGHGSCSMVRDGDCSTDQPLCTCFSDVNYYWSGDQCDIPNVVGGCLNEGAAIAAPWLGPDTVICQCPAGWTGRNCEMSTCPIVNGQVCNGKGLCVGGTCLQRVNGLNQCVLDPLFTGCGCEYDTRIYCQQPGSTRICTGFTIPDPYSQRIRPACNFLIRGPLTSLACQCPPERNGTYCERSVCLPSDIPCNGRRCYWDYSTSQPRCDCQNYAQPSSGRLLIGDLCQTDVTEQCGNPNPRLTICSGNGQCVADQNGTYSCQCNRGAIGSVCQFADCPGPCIWGSCQVVSGGSDSQCVCSHPAVWNTDISRGIYTCTANQCPQDRAYPAPDGTKCICNNTLYKSNSCTEKLCPVDADGVMCGQAASYDPVGGFEGDHLYKRCVDGQCICGWPYRKTVGSGVCEQLCHPNNTQDATHRVIFSGSQLTSVLGQCICKPGWTSSSLCNDPQCKNGGQLGGNGLCQCAGVWAGADCSAIGCQNGGVMLGLECRCQDTWFGKYCDQQCVQGQWFANSSLCQCTDGWTGSSCNVQTPSTQSPVPPPPSDQPPPTPSQPSSQCLNGGQGQPPTCTCPQPYTGGDCSQSTCSPRGTPNGDVCQCKTPYQYDSQLVTCVLPCSAQGVFDPISGLCSCRPTWTGTLCQTQVVNNKPVATSPSVQPPTAPKTKNSTQPATGGGGGGGTAIYQQQTFQIAVGLGGGAAVFVMLLYFLKGR